MHEAPILAMISRGLIKKNGHLQSSFLDGNNHPEEVLDIDDRHKRILFVSFWRKPPILENELYRLFRYVCMCIYLYMYCTCPSLNLIYGWQKFS